jgi:hypothetical protein
MQGRKGASAQGVPLCICVEEVVGKGHVGVERLPHLLALARALVTDACGISALRSQVGGDRQHDMHQVTCEGVSLGFSQGFNPRPETHVTC